METTKTVDMVINRLTGAKYGELSAAGAISGDALDQLWLASGEQGGVYFGGDKIAATDYWGGITGNLSAQTDLKQALDAKVPANRTINGLQLTSDV